MCPKILMTIWTTATPASCCGGRDGLGRAITKIVRMTPNDQGWLSPANDAYTEDDHDLWYQLNVTNITEPFIQKEGTIYWLVIDFGDDFQGIGWKETDRGFEDNAVWMSPFGVWKELFDPSGAVPSPIDLAFVVDDGQSDPTMDFGDAPDSPLTPLGYPTLLTNNGVRHTIATTIPSLCLGNDVDAEDDGQSNVEATGDDNDGNDDEDGVVFTSPITPGSIATVTVTVTSPGGADAQLDAWLDFNADGDWDDSSEKIFDNVTLTAGTHNLMFAVPITASAGKTTYARFRISSRGGLNCYGLADDGDVEDYVVQIESDANVKWIQLPDVSSNGMDIRIDNSDGDWDDTLSCPGLLAPVSAPEWAVQNQLLMGLLPGLHTISTPKFLCHHPPFTSPQETAKNIWMRITLAEQPWPGNVSVWPGYGGSGPPDGYAIGETEDYFFEPDTSCLICPDLNCDRFVDLSDLAIVASKWLQTCP